MNPETEKKKILIVDDEVALSTVLTIYLEASGFCVQAVHTGAQALQTTRTFKPHVILLDVLLPDINGWELGKQLKTTSETKDIPIIFVTALSNTDLNDRVLQLSAAEVITKPFRDDELLEKIRQFAV